MFSGLCFCGEYSTLIRKFFSFLTVFLHVDAEKEVDKGKLFPGEVEPCISKVSGIGVQCKSSIAKGTRYSYP